MRPRAGFDWFLLFPATTPAVIPGRLTSGPRLSQGGPILGEHLQRLVKRRRLKQPLTAADYLADSGRWSVNKGMAPPWAPARVRCVSALRWGFFPVELLALIGSECVLAFRRELGCARVPRATRNLLAGKICRSIGREVSLFKMNHARP
jgi:hypothetical protein